SARSAAIEFGRCSESHEIGGLHMSVRLGDGKLDSLVHTDRPSKNNTFRGVLRRAIHEPTAIADGLGSDKNSFRIPTIDDVAEAFAFFSDPVFHRDLHLFEEDGRGVVIYHDIQRL